MVADSSNSTNRILIGAPTATLTTAALVVTTQEITTTLRVGTATNGISFNDIGSTNGLATRLRFSGTARNSKKATLMPEYAGAVLTGDGGGDNIGTMTSDFCSNGNTNPPNINTTVCATSGDLHNYYSWTANATNDYDIWVNWQVPSDFDGFDTSSAIQFYGWRTSSSDAVTLTVYDDNDAVCGTGTSISGTASTWNLTNYADPTGCSAITAGDTITFRMHLTVGVNSEFARAGEIYINYLSKF